LAGFHLAETSGHKQGLKKGSLQDEPKGDDFCRGSAVRRLGEVVPGSQRVSGDKTGECPTKDVLKLDDDNSLEARRF